MVIFIFQLICLRIFRMTYFCDGGSLSIRIESTVGWIISKIDYVTTRARGEVFPDRNPSVCQLNRASLSYSISKSSYIFGELAKKKKKKTKNLIQPMFKIASYRIQRKSHQNAIGAIADAVALLWLRYSDNHMQQRQPLLAAIAALFGRYSALFFLHNKKTSG